MTPLPRLMVAPTGARRTKAEHPALPETIPEIVATAVACQRAGADGLHAHVRDSEGRHVLDAGLYGELMLELALAAPTLMVQITTEAVGRYSPADQRALVGALRPPLVSIALREITADGDRQEDARFFSFCLEAGIAVQHILYDEMDVLQLGQMVTAGIIPAAGLQVLHVLGRYTTGQVSTPGDLAGPLLRQAEAGLAPDWAACAFGSAETDCLLAAQAAGGKMRVGFENNLHNRDGTLARDNAERVAEVARLSRAEPA